MSAFLSISELATLLGTTERTIQRNCKSGKYVTREVKSVGGASGISYEIALESLPEYAQQKYKKQQADKALENIKHIIEDTNKNNIKTVSKEVSKPNRYELDNATQKQRDINYCINTIFKWITAYPGTKKDAVAAINRDYADKVLESSMVHALEHCKHKLNSHKKTDAPILTLSTIEKWEIRFKKQGNYLPMERQKDKTVLPWHESALTLYQRPQKPTIQMVAEQLRSAFIPPPSYWEVRRFLNHKVSRMELNKGRHTGMAGRAKKAFRKRTRDGLVPWQILHADGWATHFTAPHPITGEYVTYEVWDFHDVATRYVPPFSIGLSENHHVIARGIENAVRDQGKFSSLQTDSTKIIKKNKKFTGDEQISLLDGLGSSVYHPTIVGNAQANGISENFHAWLDKQAREIATYQAKGMDSLTLRNNQRFTRQLVKAKKAGDIEAENKARAALLKSGKGIIFETYEQACEWLEQKRQKWNHHHHSELNKIFDESLGRMRHQSPQECLDEFKADGWEPDLLSENALLDAFRPKNKLKVRRGMVTPYGKMQYRHPELDHWEGLEVTVSYDIMDYKHVRVLDKDSSLICIAEHQEAVGYRSQTALEAAEEKRALDRAKRKQKQADDILEGAGINQPSINSTSVSIFDQPAIEVEEVKKINIFDIAGQSEGEVVEKLSAEESMKLIWGVVGDDD